ncbi:MAG: ATP-binding protein [Vicinamibacterales bacterium]
MKSISKAKRRIVLVSGMPGSGKTTLATALAEALGFTLVSKDYIKETLVDTLAPGPGDLATSRQFGGAAMEVLWAVAAHARDVVLEANFRPHSSYERTRLVELKANVVEVFCECSREEASRRFARRAQDGMHAAHPLTVLPDSVMDEYDGPVAVGAVIRVSTMAPVDVVNLAERVQQAWLPEGDAPVFQDEHAT